MFTKNDSRFKTIYSSTNDRLNFRIILDTETGVNYLFSSTDMSAGLTVLRDSNDKPIITLDK